MSVYNRMERGQTLWLNVLLTILKIWQIRSIEILESEQRPEYRHSEYCRARIRGPKILSCGSTDLIKCLSNGYAWHLGRQK